MSRILIAQFDDFDAAHATAGELRTFGVAQGDMEFIAAAAGLAVGAYTGSLHGAMNKLGDTPAAVETPPRPAGVRLAVNVLPPSTRDSVLATFRRHGAHSIEEAEGTWRDGTWVEFDPVTTPRWVEAPPVL